MITYERLTKKTEGVYEMVSKPCPMCNETFTAEIKGEELFAYNNGALIQNAFPNLTASERERFKSGYCGTCWEKLFQM
jgi:hypothetical protein